MGGWERVYRPLDSRYLILLDIVSTAFRCRLTDYYF
jgi:hypothetical protein